jgi:hypothetical protein
MWKVSPTKVVFQTRVVDRDALAVTHAAVEFNMEVKEKKMSKL